MPFSQWSEVREWSSKGMEHGQKDQPKDDLALTAQVWSGWVAGARRSGSMIWIHPPLDLVRLRGWVINHAI